MQIFRTADELKAMIGKTIGPSEWLTVDQDTINAFADATGDRQWIHVDVERAKRESPAGTTIAHGYLLLSLIGRLQPMIYKVESRQTLNYGIEKLRFLNMVRSGARIHLKEELQSIEDSGKGYRVISRLTIEIEGEERPAIVADVVFLYFF